MIRVNYVELSNNQYKYYDKKKTHTFFFVSVRAQGDPLISALRKNRQVDLYAFRAVWQQSEFQSS